MMFQKLVLGDGTLEVTEISERKESKERPVGLNTVNLLKVTRYYSMLYSSIGTLYEFLKLLKLMNARKMYNTIIRLCWLDKYP